MKRFLALALCLMLLTVHALAQAEEAVLEELDFGWFTLTVDPEMPGSVTNRVSNETMLTYFPDYNPEETFHANLNVVWSEDISQVPAEEELDLTWETLSTTAIESFEASGLTVSEMELNAIGLVEFDGDTAVRIVYSYIMDCTPLGLNLEIRLYVMQIILPDAFGTGIWTLTGTATSIEALEERVEPVMNTFHLARV